MYRLFDKHGTKFLAVIGSLLMLAFILPSDWAHRGPGSNRFGKLDGQELSGDAIHATQDRLRSLSSVIVTIPDRQNQPQSLPVSQAIFRAVPELLREVSNNPVQWYLLVKEAERAGVVPDESLIENIMSGQTQLRTEDGQMLLMKDINPSVRDAYAAALREAIAVSENFSRSSSRAIKVSDPAINEALAKQFQQLRVRIVPFDVSAFATKVTAPTDDALNTQFKAYADVVPAVSVTNPFGFGYRVPDRVTAQWITLPDSEVERAVEANKAPELWEEDAIIYYQKNPSSFQTAATQPTTRPYADAKADVLKQIRQPLIESTRRAIANRVTQQMQADAKAAGKSGATTQQALDARTAYGVPFRSLDYLQKLSDDIQKQFHVKLTIVNQAAPMSQEQLQAPGALGFTYTDDNNLGAEYLFSAVKAFNPSGTLALGAPSKVLLSEAGLNIVRVLSAERAHAASNLSDVKAQVERDVRQENAFSLASESADKAISDARTADGLDKVSGLKPMTSDWFGAATGKITGLTGADAYSAQLIDPAYDALRNVTSASKLPAFSVAKFQRQGTAVALEVFDIKTSLNTADAQEQRLQAEAQLQQQLRPQGAAAQWFSFDAVSQRMGYVPDASTKKAEMPSGAPTQQPGSPFIPG